jgi:hypothetical protein
VQVFAPSSTVADFFEAKIGVFGLKTPILCFLGEKCSAIK